MVFHFVTMVHGDTATGGRLARKREVRLETILDAATSILASDGLEAVTLQRVATATGYVPAALYRYVGSKDGLLALLQRRAVADAHRAFLAAQEALRERTAKADDRVAAIAAIDDAARFYLDLPRTHPETWLLIAVLLGDPRPLLSDDESRRTAPVLLAFLGDVHGLFERAAEVGALRPGDAQRRTLAHWATLHGALGLEKMRRIAPGFPSAADVGRDGSRALLAAWGAEDAVLTRAARLVGDAPRTRRGRT